MSSRVDPQQPTSSEIARQSAVVTSESALRALYDMAPVCMGVTEVLEGDVLHCYDNAATCRLLGVPAGATVNRRFVGDLGGQPAVAAEWIARYREAEATGEPVHFDHLHRRADEARWLSVTVTMLGPGPAGRTRFCYVAEDLTERDRTAAALRGAGETFRRMVDDSPFGVIVVDADFRVAHVSVGARKTFENVRPLIGRNLADVMAALWQEPFASEATARYRHTLATGESYRAARTVEKRHDIAEVAAYDWQVDRVILPDGRPGVVCHFYDLSEQQRYETALQESEERFRTLADNMSQFAWMADPQGWIFWYNQRWYDFTGTTLEQMQGWGWKDVHHPEHCERVVDRWQRTLAQGKPWEDTFPLRGKDGNFRWFLSRAIPIRNAAGEVVRWFGTNTDITDLRAAEEAVRRSEQFVRRVLDNLFAFVGVLLPDGTLVSVNQAPLQAAGLGSDEVLDRKFWDCAWWSYSEVVQSDLRAACDRALRGEVVRYDVQVRMAGGALMWIDFQIAPLRDADGAITHLIPSAMDITARRAAESALREASERAVTANAAKDKFLAALSHELRTPLSPILLATAIFGEDLSLPEEVRDAFAMIRESVQLEAQLIDDLLDVARITQGKLRFKMGPCDIASIVANAASLVRPDADESRLTLEIEHSGPPPVVEGDATRLKQVVWNLLRNAIKFTPGGGRIAVSSGSCGGMVRVRVRDSGIGIPAEDLERIFRAFEQTDSSRSRQNGGLGLGLAISASIVAEHGGRIWAESAGDGAGSTFHFELPLCALPVPDRSNGGAADAPARGVPLRILLVEDHEATRAALQRMLRRRGHHVAEAASLAAARRLAAGQTFDVLITDLGLPDGSGTDLMRELKAGFGLSGIMLTGHGMEDDVRRSEEAGAVAHLVKPIDFSSLEALLARWSR